MKNRLLFFVIIACFLGCTDQEDGNWNDPIKLSKKEVLFSTEKNTTTITTKGASWWIHSIFFKEGDIFDLHEYNTIESDFIITSTDFTLERKNGTEIFITLFKNPKPGQRTLIIGLQAGNYFDVIKITQAAP